MTIATHENGKWTVTTGTLTTVFCNEAVAAAWIGLLQQEIEKLRARLKSIDPATNKEGMTMAEIKFEVGKHYRTRGGMQVKLLEIWPDGMMLFSSMKSRSVFWTYRSGQYGTAAADCRDIVSQWQGEDE